MRRPEYLVASYSVIGHRVKVRSSACPYRYHRLRHLRSPLTREMPGLPLRSGTAASPRSCSLESPVCRRRCCNACSLLCANARAEEPSSDKPKRGRNRMGLKSAGRASCPLWTLQPAGALGIGFNVVERAHEEVDRTKRVIRKVAAFVVN